MSRRVTVLSLALVLIVGSARISRAAEASDRRIFVFEAGTSTLAAIDAANGSILGRSEALGYVTRGFRTPDGSRIILLHDLPGPAQGDTETVDRVPSNPRAYILDAESLKTIGRLDLALSSPSSSVAWRLQPDGRRVAILCAAALPDKKSSPGPAVLLIADTETGEQVGRLDLGRCVPRLALDPTGHTILVYDTAAAEGASSGVRLIDFASAELIATIALPGSLDGPVGIPGEDLLYFVDRGKPHRRQDKNVNGKIWAVSLSKKAVEKVLDAGSDPRGPWFDTQAGRLLFLNDVPETEGAKKPDGELRAIRGGETVATLKVGWSPKLMRLSDDGSRVFVAGPRHVSVADLSKLETVGRTDANTGTLVDFAVSPDGKRAFEIYDQQRLAVIDLEGHKIVNKLTMGRAGMRLLKGLAQMSPAVGMYQLVSDLHYEAEQRGARSLLRGEHLARGALLVRPDGKFAYALNTETTDTTVVDAETGKTVDHIGVGGAVALELLPGGAIAAANASSVILIDTQANKQIADIDVGRVQGMGYDFEGNLQSVSGKKGLVLLDPKTGQPRTRVEGLRGPTVIVP